MFLFLALWVERRAIHFWVADQDTGMPELFVGGREQQYPRALVGGARSYGADDAGLAAQLALPLQSLARRISYPRQNGQDLMETRFGL